ncbi:MAG: phage minor capsid protein [Firmicutes bacterium]|nr:phage minor capsid protein [Bacillota bacterium]
MDGLEGANCRHIRSVWVEGVSERTYTDEQLANIDKPPFQYEGKTYTTYEATQKQRQIERTIRKLKRDVTAFKAAGLDDEAQTSQIRMKRLSKEYTAFSKAAGLREQRERMQVEYTESMTDEQMEALKTITSNGKKIMCDRISRRKGSRRTLSLTFQTAHLQRKIFIGKLSISTAPNTRSLWTKLWL